MLARLADLAAWTGGVPSSRIASLEAARRGDWLLVRGTRLPLLAEASRFWGKSLLLPLGWRLEPALLPEAIREALGVSAEEIVLWTEAGPEAIPEACFQPLSRASIRLALEQVSEPQASI
jgi:hypothetical protein